MKKTLALITLHDVKNYGSALQAYATQVFFERLGFDVTVIDYRRPWETTLGYWFYLRVFSLKGILRNVLYFPSKIIQKVRFKQFLKNYVHSTPNHYYTSNQLKEKKVMADVYCTGSDQVWNSGWNKGVIPAYFLDFVEKGEKKVSFASSFGSSCIEENEKETIKDLLSEYDLITVREKQSVEMLEKAFQLKAYEILDPTLQIEKDFWDSLCKKERIIKEKYVLLIQLNRSHQFDELAEAFAKEKNCKLVRLCLRVDQAFLSGKSVVIPKVENYISLIRDSEYVLTDSFHAVSFSLNFNKEFYVFYPKEYSDRLASILDIMDLNDRVLNQYNKSKNSVIDYERVNVIIEKKRSECMNIFENII